MTSIAYSCVSIQTCSQAAPSVPPWLGEVALIVPRAQRLQWFLWESDWSEREVQAERLRLLREDASTAPTAQGVLVIDETGVSLDGHNTAHVSRQYLAKSFARSTTAWSR
jgi:SRSO17 transposase